MAASKAGSPRPRKTSPRAANHTAATRNGSHKAVPQIAVPNANGEEAVKRAEDMLDETGRKIGALMAGLSLRLRKAAAVAREEAEDLWAEAQSIRRGETS